MQSLNYSLPTPFIEIISKLQLQTTAPHATESPRMSSPAPVFQKSQSHRGKLHLNQKWPISDFTTFTEQNQVKIQENATVRLGFDSWRPLRENEEKPMGNK